MKKLLVLTTFLLAASSVVASQYNNTPDAISERIQKIGTVCLEGEACAKDTVAAATTVATASSGSDTYSTYCAVCHAAGVAGAPITNDQAAWSSRIDSKGLETVYANAINGIGGMPAKGMCMTCSDDDIKTTIDYMLGQAGVN